MGWWGDFKSNLGLGDPMRKEGQYGGVDRANFDLPGGDAARARDEGLGAQYGMRAAPQAADSAFRQYQMSQANRLQNLASGADSVSARQLKQQQAQLGNQQASMVAGAAPQNAAAAQRMAMQNQARGAQGLAFNQALAGIQERNAATGALAGLAGQARGQDLGLNQFNVGAQLQQTGLNDAAQNSAYNRQLGYAQAQQQGGMGYEQQRTQRAAAAMGTPSKGEALIGAAMGGMQAVAASDRSLKTNIKPGAPEANAFMDSVSPATYAYKNPSQIGMPPGLHTGVMAQDLEKTPAGKGAVTTGPDGKKMVDYGQLGGVMTASLAALNDRLKQIEAQRGPKVDVQGDPRRAPIEVQGDPRRAPVDVQGDPRRASLIDAVNMGWFDRGRK